MLFLAEEDVYARSSWAGGRALPSEVRDGLTLNGILLVFQGEYDMSDMLEPPGWGIGGGKGVTGKEDEFHEGTEMNCPAMAVAFEVLA